LYFLLFFVSTEAMNFLEEEGRYFFHTYTRLPIMIDRGEGVYLFDREGTRYLDFFGGLAVNALGYGHPRVVRAIAEQSAKFTHLSNYFISGPALSLARELTRITGYGKVFFTNSGTEGIEGALKIARKWGSASARTTVISFSNAFHGRTYGALSMMDRPKYREGFGPFLDNFMVLPYNDVAALRRCAGPTTLAVVLELIQGEGGVVPASPEFVAELAVLKERHGFLLIADEIQTGVGRTGKFLASDHHGLRPELVVIAKPLGGGLPLGAILGTGPVEKVLDVGEHGTTFGGNPVCCAAGLVVLDEITGGGLMEKAATTGDYLLQRLNDLRTRSGGAIRSVRGRGLMVGVEMAGPCLDTAARLLQKGLLANCTAGNVIRLLPPLTIGREHVDEAVSIMEQVIK
jgi:predicted acetylornithine/succinylornithine family transaminase